MLQTSYGCHFLVFRVVVEGITVTHVRKLKFEVITCAFISFPAAATIEGMVYSLKFISHHMETTCEAKYWTDRKDIWSKIVNLRPNARKMSRVRWGRGLFSDFFTWIWAPQTNILLLNWNFSWLASPSHLKVRPRSKSFTLSLLGHVSFAVVLPPANEVWGKVIYL